MKEQERVVIGMIVSYAFVVLTASVLANVYWMVIQGMTPETGSPVAEVMMMSLLIAIPTLFPFVLNGVLQYFGAHSWPAVGKMVLAVVVLSGGYHIMQGYTLEGKSSFWTTDWTWLPVALSVIVCLIMPFTRKGLIPSKVQVDKLSDNL